MATSPTQLTLKNLRERGYMSEVVEHWNSFARIRQDLFGIIDVIGVGNGETIAVQSTSYTNTSARQKKMMDSIALPEIRDANWKVEIHGWHKVKNRWKVRIIDLS